MGGKVPQGGGFFGHCNVKFEGYIFIKMIAAIYGRIGWNSKLAGSEKMLKVAKGV